MWAIFILLFILMLGLLGYISYLRNQVAHYKLEEGQQFMMHQSNLLSKQLLAQWIQQKEQNKEISDYLRKKGMKRVAIYGMAEVGELLYQELEKTDIAVICGIDKCKTSYGQKVVRPEDFQEDVDVVLVTAIYYFSEIYDFLNQRLRGSVPILGLDEVIFELSGDLNTF